MASPTMGAVKHVLLAKFKDDVPQERIDELVRAYANLLSFIPLMKSFHRLMLAANRNMDNNYGIEFLLLDSAGEMVDLLYAGSLSIRGHAVVEQQRKKNDQQRVLKFVTDHQPQVVCLGGANLFCKQLKDELYELRDPLAFTELLS